MYEREFVICYVYHSNGSEILCETARTFSNFDNGSECFQQIVACDGMNCREGVIFLTLEDDEMSNKDNTKDLHAILDPKKIFFINFLLQQSLLRRNETTSQIKLCQRN